eukprot:7888625-Alexandrium_andersonii.AAC.1
MASDRGAARAQRSATACADRPRRKRIVCADARGKGRRARDSRARGALLGRRGTALGKSASALAPST